MTTHSPTEPIFVQFGEGTTWGMTVPPGNDAIASQGQYSDNVRVDRDKKGHIQLSADIRDEDGHLIGRIDHNRWRVSNQQSECWDKNYRDNALEVMDGKGRIVFWVKLLPNKVQMQAVWLMEHMAIGRLTNNGIGPIFQYPSKDHWGEFNNKMKEPEYIEGKQAQENFEEGMKALFKVPKRSCKGRARGDS